MIVGFDIGNRIIGVMGGDEIMSEIEKDIEPTPKMIAIPNNATNGDMIKAIFPSIESRLDEKTGIMLVKWTDGTTKTFKASWWNAPYKESK